MVLSNSFLLKFLLPLVAEQLLAILVGLADTLMASSICESAVDAISIVDQVFIFINILLSSFASGGVILVSRFFGAKNFPTLKKTVHLLFILLIIYAAILMIIAFAFKIPLMNFLFPAIDEEIRNLANPYFYTLVFSIPCVALFNCSCAIFRGLGKTSTSMWISLLMNILNIAGNFITVQFFDLGISGIAASTFISRFCAGFVGIVIIAVFMNHTTNKNKQENYSTAPENSSFALAGKICSLALPSSLENGLYQLGKLLVMTFIGKMGSLAIAANAACNVVSSVGVVTGFAASNALLSLVAVAYGEKNPASIRDSIRKIMTFVYASFAIINIPIFIFAPQIALLFRYSPESTVLAVQLIRYHALFCTFFWPTSSAFPSALRALGDVKFTLLVSSVSMWIIRIGICYILSFTFNLGVLGVWIAMSIEWIVKSACFLLRYRKIYKKFTFA